MKEEGVGDGGDVRRKGETSERGWRGVAEQEGQEDGAGGVPLASVSRRIFASEGQRP